MVEESSDEDKIRFDTGGTERMIIDGASVGIGTSSPGDMNASANNLVVGSGASSDNTGITIFSNSNASGSIHFADGTSGAAAYAGDVFYNHSNDYMGFLTGGTQRLRLDSDGLKFGSDTAAANALDDYEEGTFTPTVTSGITSVGYSAQTGYYTKIGNLVMFNLRIATSSGNAQSSTFAVGNLPFNSAATQQPGGAAIRAYASSFSSSGSQAFIGPASNSISFYTLAGTAFAGTSITDHDGFDLRITGIYRA
jgi:hypothetical protein